MENYELVRYEYKPGVPCWAVKATGRTVYVVSVREDDLDPVIGELAPGALWIPGWQESLEAVCETLEEAKACKAACLKRMGFEE